jgi:hypothetical protein
MATLMQIQPDRIVQMQKWEYRIIGTYNDVKILDELGEDGWEMCGSAPTSQMYTAALYFKRPKRQEKISAIANIQSVRMESITDEQKDKLIKSEQGKQEENENKDTDYWN